MLSRNKGLLAALAFQMIYSKITDLKNKSCYNMSSDLCNMLMCCCPSLGFHSDTHQTLWGRHFMSVVVAYEVCACRAAPRPPCHPSWSLLSPPSGGSDCSLPPTALGMSLGVSAFVTFGTENLIPQSTAYCSSHCINVILGLSQHNRNFTVSLDLNYRWRQVTEDAETSKVPTWESLFHHTGTHWKSSFLLFV